MLLHHVLARPCSSSRALRVLLLLCSLSSVPSPPHYAPATAYCLPLAGALGAGAIGRPFRIGRQLVGRLPRILLRLLLLLLLLRLRPALPVGGGLLRLLLGMVPQVVVVAVLCMLCGVQRVKRRAQRAAGGAHLPVGWAGALRARRLLGCCRHSALLPPLPLQAADR